MHEVKETVPNWLEITGPGVSKEERLLFAGAKETWAVKRALDRAFEAGYADSLATIRRTLGILPR